MSLGKKLFSYFYPRSPCGERRDIDLTDFNKSVFLSTLSLRRATCGNAGIGTPISISIHALLAESDTVTARIIDPTYDFYPRSPCGERPMSGTDFYRSAIISIHALLAESDMTHTLLWRRQKLFLSTLSLRRATQAKDGTNRTAIISIHALLAESDTSSGVICLAAAISIHALLAESDS